MNDIPDIGLIDPHPKGYCGHDDVDAVVHPLLLNELLPIFVNLGMVKGCLVASTIQLSTHLFALTLGETVNNATFVPVLADDAFDVFQDVFGLLTHLVIEVGPIERRLKKVTSLDPQASDNVLLYYFSHRGSQS